MKKLSVCLLKYDMTEKSGGDRVAAILSEALTAHFDVHLVSVCGKGEKPFFTVSPKVHYKALLPGHDRIRGTLLSGSRALRRYVKEEEIDVILTVGGNVNFFMWYAARGRNVRQVFCEHLAAKDVADRLFRYLAVKTADRIVVLTERSRRGFLDAFRLSGEKVEVIHNWIDPALLKTEATYDPNSKKIISVGRFCPQKGYDLLVEIAAEFFKKHPDWRWDIYGDGPDFDVVKALVEEKSLGDKLFLMGSTSRLYELYGEYAFYAMTSRMEGLPMVLLEAKAQRLPLVSFDCPTGPSEIIRDGVDGFLAGEENVPELTEKICRLAEDTALREKFSQAAHGNLREFSYEDIVGQWKDLIEKLCQEA